MERIIHCTVFVDADEAIKDEEILKALEVSLPGTSIVKAFRNGKAVSAVIDGFDASKVTKA